MTINYAELRKLIRQDITILHEWDEYINAKIAIYFYDGMLLTKEIVLQTCHVFPYNWFARAILKNQFRYKFIENNKMLLKMYVYPNSPSASNEVWNQYEEDLALSFWHYLQEQEKL